MNIKTSQFKKIIRETISDIVNSDTPIDEGVQDQIKQLSQSIVRYLNNAQLRSQQNPSQAQQLVYRAFDALKSLKGKSTSQTAPQVVSPQAAPQQTPPIIGNQPTPAPTPQSQAQTPVTDTRYPRFAPYLPIAYDDSKPPVSSSPTARVQGTGPALKMVAPGRRKIYPSPAPQQPLKMAPQQPLPQQQPLKMAPQQAPVQTQPKLTPQQLAAQTKAKNAEIKRRSKKVYPQKETMTEEQLKNLIKAVIEETKSQQDEGKLRSLAAAGLIGLAGYTGLQHPVGQPIKQAWTAATTPRHIEVPNPNEELPSEKGMSGFDLAQKYSDRNTNLAHTLKPLTNKVLKETPKV